VLAITPWDEPEGGGLERYAHTLLRRLAARGHEARVLCFTRQTPGVVDRDGVEVERLAPRWRVSNTPIHPGFRRAVASSLERWRPDVLVAHTTVPFPAEMASLAAERAGVPVVVTYHAGRLEGGSPLLDAVAAMDRATLERRMLSHAKALVAVSPYVRDHALQAHRAKVHVVPPGVDHTMFRPGPTPPAGPAQDVLFAGPLAKAYRWKGLDTLWAAFTRLHRDLPQARLVLVGDGDRRAALEQRAREEALPVVFRGRVPLERLVEAYRACAVAVLPSTSPAESFGMVLAEANACGKPVVGSRIGGIPDFVRHGENGLLAPPGDAEGLAAALRTLLQDPDRARAMGEAGRVRVLREHDWDALAQRTEAILLDAAGQAPRPAPLHAVPH
jgi:glycosyltransferase involved in cell wall biosynthesis